MMMGAAIIGALITGIPLTGVICYEKQTTEQVEESLTFYEQMHEQFSYASIFVLTRDAVAGEELTEDMFSEQRVQSTESLSGLQPLKQSDLIGKRLKISLTKGASLGTDIVYEGAPVSDDERRVELRELDLPETLRENEFVDIRIVFPDGEDYLVVGHKRVYRLIRDDDRQVLALQLRLFEEELLRYQAACVDTRTYKDTRLYAVQYTGEFQASAEAFYPVNEAVFQLLQWDPNIVELFTVEAEQERRACLESQMEHFVTDQGQSADDPQQPQELITGPTEPKEPLTLYTGLPEET